jgi:hypothetical protein
MAREPDRKIHWVPKDAFVMPVLPKSLKIDALVAGFLHMVAFLELSGDDAVDPDWAVEAMEHVGYYFGLLSPKAKADFGSQVARVATHAKKEKWGKPAVEFFEQFMENIQTEGEVDE